eukprot:g6206.t1
MFTLFNFPNQFQDLEFESTEEGCLTVSSVKDLRHTDEKTISSLVRRCSRELLSSSHALAISDQETFDLVYSLVRHVKNDQSSFRDALIDLFCSCLSLFFSKESNENDENRDNNTTTTATNLQHRNRITLKVYLYFLSQLVAFDVKKDKNLVKKELSAGIRVTKMFLLTLSLENSHALKRCFSLGVPEDPFLMFFIRFSLLHLEQKHVVKCKPLCSNLLHLLAVVSVRFPSSQASLRSGVQQLLMSCEHFTIPMADFIHLLFAKYEGARLATEIVTEVAEMNFDGSRNSSGMKNAARFIEDLADRAPSFIRKNTDVLVPLLDAQAYAIRNAVITTVGKLCVLSANDSKKAVAVEIAFKKIEDREAEEDELEEEEEEEESKKESNDGVQDDVEQQRETQKQKDFEARDALLEILLVRVHDKSSYVRARCLQTWTEMCSSGAIPRNKLVDVALVAVERLDDKASLVRKRAAQLLSALVDPEDGPFAFDSERLWGNEQAERRFIAHTSLEEIEKKIETMQVNAAKEILEDENSDSSNLNSELLSELSMKHEKQLLVVQYYDTVHSFVDVVISRAIPRMRLMLRSESTSDVHVSMKFFCVAKGAHLPGISKSLCAMLALVWSKEEIRDALIQSFDQMYLANHTPLRVAVHLVEYIKNLAASELTSFEYLIRLLIKEKHLQSEVAPALWRMLATVTKKKEQPLIEQAAGALSILGMMGTANPSYISGIDRTKLLLLAALTPSESIGIFDLKLARNACIVLKGQSFEEIEDKIRQCVVSRLSSLIRGDWNISASLAKEWYGVAEEALGAIFSLYNENKKDSSQFRPEKVCEKIIKHMYCGVFEGGEETSERMHASAVELSRLLFVAGHVALLLLAHGERLADLAKSKRKELIKKRSEKNSCEKKKKDSVEEELGLLASADHAEDEALAKLAEEGIVGRQLLGAFGPIVVRIVANQDGTFSQSLLRESAVLTLCKFMCVSRAFTLSHLQLLFTLLEKDDSNDNAALRTTVVVALGDIAVRFPIALNPWNKYLYRRLQDPSENVRSQVLMVLTYLILQDQIKLKGYSHELAHRLEDEQPHIRQLARLFFIEYDRKATNNIYNIFVDTVSMLANDASKENSTERDVEKFKRTCQFLSKFITKEKQFEKMVSQLCQRIQTATQPAQWRLLSFVLALFPYEKLKAKVWQKLVTQFESYKAAIAEDQETYVNFISIAKKVVKSRGSKKDEEGEAEADGVLGEEWIEKMKKTRGNEEEEGEKKDQKLGAKRVVLDALIPGLTVGFMVVPQSIAYALLAGLPPIYGLYSSTMSIFVYALFGTSPQLAIGPVALVSLLTKGTIDAELANPENAKESEVVEIALALSLLVGMIQLIFGLLRLGGVTQFLSHDVLIGFTASSAIIIGFSQLKYIFGITIGRHHYPWETFMDVFKNLHQTKIEELFVSFSCLALLISMKIWRKKNPVGKGKDEKKWKKIMRIITSMSALVVILVYIPLSLLLSKCGINLKIVGPQPSGFPLPSLPSFSRATSTSTLFMSALVISLIGFMESYAVAVSVQKEEDPGVNANREFCAMGLANIAGSFFNSYPAAGSFGRTAVSSRSGAKSQLSGLITGLFVVVSLLFLMPLFTYLPYCALASIIEVAVFNLIDVEAFRTAWRVSKSEFTVSVFTFFMVLAIGIEGGVLFGVLLSICMVLYRASHPHFAVLGKLKNGEKSNNDFAAAGTWHDTTRFESTLQPLNTVVLRIDSSIFFANTLAVKAKINSIILENRLLEATMDAMDVMDNVRKLPSEWNQEDGGKKEDGERNIVKGNRLENLVLHLSNCESIDLSGLHLLVELDSLLEKKNIRFALTSPCGPVRDKLVKMHHFRHSEDKQNGSLESRVFESIDLCLEKLNVVV